MPNSRAGLNLFFEKYGIFLVVTFAVIVRFAGILYALPLTSLVADESGLVFAALKMIQLKTLLPGMHAAAFEPILYYPPYLAYLFIPPFLAVAGIKYLFLGSSGINLQNYFAANLSPFFIAARLINIVFAVISIYLVYKIAYNIFQNKKTAILSGFFLATSLLHMSLSMVARHWLPASFIFLSGLFFLSNQAWSFKKRYFLAVLTAGIGMGLTPISGLIGVLILFWYLFYENHSLTDLLKEKFFYKLLPLFLLLAAVPIMLYPASYNFFRGSGAGVKTFSGVLTSPVFFLKLAFITEPVLMFFAVLGIFAVYFSHKKLFWASVLFIFVYSTFFYLIYWYLHRFILPLLCILAIFSGYGFTVAWNYSKKNIFRIALIILLLMPAAVALRFSYLAFKGDSRLLARTWAEKNITAGSKIIVSGETRLLATKDAVEEKRMLDPNSINKFDSLDSYTDEFLRGAPVYHALNLDYVDAESSFYDNPGAYILKNNYKYLIANTGDERFFVSDELKKRSKLLKTFGTAPDLFTHYNNEFFAYPLGLFQISELGPSVTIYQIE